MYNTDNPYSLKFVSNHRCKERSPRALFAFGRVVKIGEEAGAYPTEVQWIADKFSAYSQLERRSLRHLF